jgi:hypothetical protein
MLMRVAQDGADESTREAAAKALQYLQNFARDVVDSGYTIRTKELGGNQQVPVDENNMVLDLASFVFYERLVPSAECTGKLSSALIGYQSPLDVDCGNGIGWLYELVATWGHYYNYEIVRYFHVASLYNALMVGANDTAYALMEGMVDRVNYFMYDDPNQAAHAEWFADGVPFLVAAAATGFPLTSEEARTVADEYSLSADYYSTWAYWDPWDPSVPEGAVPLTPDRSAPGGPAVPWDGMLFLLEYCYSPLVNPATAPLVDCDVVRDPAQWGE